MSANLARYRDLEARYDGPIPRHELSALRSDFDAAAHARQQRESFHGAVSTALRGIRKRGKTPALMHDLYWYFLLWRDWNRKAWAIRRKNEAQS